MFRGQLFNRLCSVRCIFPANHARTAEIATIRDVRANFQRELLLSTERTVSSTVDVEEYRRSEVKLEWTSKLRLEHVCCVLLTGGRGQAEPTHRRQRTPVNWELRRRVAERTSDVG